MSVGPPLISADEFMYIQTPDTVRLELDEGVLVVKGEHLISADEFMHIETPDTIRLELDEGVLVVSPHNSAEHQIASRQLLIVLTNWAERTRAGQVLAEMDLRLNDQIVRAPDLVFIASEQIHILKRRRIVGAPRLVVEILSGSTAALDRGPKMQQYAAAGVPSYWLVDPIGKGIEAYELQDGAFVLNQRCGEHGVFQPAGFSHLRIELERWIASLPPDED